MPSYDIPTGYGAPPSYGAPAAAAYRAGYDRSEMYGPYGDILEDEVYNGVRLFFIKLHS